MRRWLVAALLPLATSRRVLVTTFGGSGATGVMGALRAAGFATNSISDGDRLKFMPLTRMGRELTAKMGLMCEKKRSDKCFDRVFVVLRDDPVRALASIIGSTPQANRVFEAGPTPSPRRVRNDGLVLVIIQTKS